MSPTHWVLIFSPCWLSYDSVQHDRWCQVVFRQTSRSRCGAGVTGRSHRCECCCLWKINPRAVVSLREHESTLCLRSAWWQRKENRNKSECTNYPAISFPFRVSTEVWLMSAGTSEKLSWKIPPLMICAWARHANINFMFTYKRS